jgi:hypothetical protein
MHARWSGRASGWLGIRARTLRLVSVEGKQYGPYLLGCDGVTLFPLVSRVQLVRLANKDIAVIRQTVLCHKSFSCADDIADVHILIVSAETSAGCMGKIPAVTNLFELGHIYQLDKCRLLLGQVFPE